MRVETTAEEVARWITCNINKIEGLEKCVVRAVTPLAEADDTGCNWSDSIIVSNSSLSAEETTRLLHPVILEARKCFNIGH